MDDDAPLPDRMIRDTLREEREAAQCAQSEDYIKPADVLYIVQADYNNRSDLRSENRPQRDMEGVLACVTLALDLGATEVRVRPARRYPTEGS